MRRVHIRRWAAAMPLAVALVFPSTWTIRATEVGAAYTYMFSDDVRPIVLAVRKPSISGEHMVWIAPDATGAPEVFYLNLSTGATRQLTHDRRPKELPKVSGSADGNVYVAWTDKRSMYGYDLASGRTRKLSSKDGMYTDFVIDGGDVVWYDNFRGTLTHYDLRRDVETDLGPGRSPAVADGKVLYKNAEDGGLTLRELASGRTRPVVELPYHLYVVDHVFNGRYALYRQADLDSQTKYVLLDVSDPEAGPVDLTPMTKRAVEYYQMYIGEREAAWVQDVGGEPALVGVDLASRRTYTVATGEEALRALAVRDGEVLFRTPDMRLLVRRVMRVETTAAAPGGAEAPVSSEAASRMIGPEGGELSTADGGARLVVPPGAVAAPTVFELRAEADSSESGIGSEAVRDGASWRPASRRWAVRFDAALNKPAALSLAYEPPERWTAWDVRKMAAYRAESGGWERVGGRMERGNGKVTAFVVRPGTYALWVREVGFRDTAGHWAKAEMEVLASRGIVDGVGEERFAPEGVLTRAQFVKMVLGALGVRAVGSRTPFADVPAEHWASGWIAEARERGLVQGVGERFEPDAPLTLEQMAALLVRALGREREAQALEAGQTASLLGAFADEGDIGGWARPYLAEAVRAGLLQGEDGRIRPKRTATRAEAAAVLVRLLDRLETEGTESSAP